jgi:hypothetical protein
MNGESEKPLRLLINPFTFWTDLALKTGEALWASAHAAAVRANAPKVAVIPTADAQAPKPETPKVAVLPAADARPRKARASARQPSKAVRSRAARTKPRTKASAKRRARR